MYSGSAYPLKYPALALMELILPYLFHHHQLKQEKHTVFPIFINPSKLVLLKSPRTNASTAT